MKLESQLLFRIHFLFVIFRPFSTTTVTVASQPTIRETTEWSARMIWLLGPRATSNNPNSAESRRFDLPLSAIIRT